jgi:hypothetical protein
MKKNVLIISLVLSCSVLYAAPQEDEWCSISKNTTLEKSELLGVLELDAFVAFAKQAILTRDSIQIISCFGPFISFSSELNTFNPAEVSRDDFILSMVDEFGSFDNFSSYLGLLLHGFEMKNEEGKIFFSNTHVKVENNMGEIEVIGNFVNFRSEPSVRSNIICKLNNGVYSGMVNPNLLEVKDPKGFNWIPVRLHHPSFGMISGYIAEDYLKEIAIGKSPVLEIHPVNGHWRIQKVKFISS